MTNNFRTTITNEANRYFTFCTILDKSLKQVKVEDTYFFNSCYVCFNGFIHSLLSYLFSVYDDLDQEEYLIMPKSNANRILLRNCLEANLILNVLQNHPTYSEKFYATLQSDIDRIKETYNVIDQNSIDLKKYMKRFSWLPRIKGKKCTSLKDVLHFVDFDNYDLDYFYYNTLIKNFDTFIHPSFKFAQQIRASNQEEIKNISCLFITGGIIYDCCSNCLSNLMAIYEDKIDKEVYQKLDKILKDKHYDLHELSIKDAYFNLNKNVDNYIHSLPSSINNLAQSIDTSNYKNTNIVYLLFDLSSHYDDMLVSYYTYDIMMFYAQARYVIESLSLIYCLYRDDEERSRIYYLHQNIKSHDAKISAMNFLGQFSLKGNEDPIDVNNLHVENIAQIKSYYKTIFNKDVEDNKISRLNGWALYLKDINNDIVPNSPFFVELMGRELINNKEITHYLLGFYEESNAFTHITPYAFDPKQNNFNLKKPLLLINELLKRLVTNLISFYDLRMHLSNEDILLIDSGIYFATKKFSDDVNNKNLKINRKKD